MLKRKIIIALFAVVFVVTSILGISACGEQDSQNVNLPDDYIYTANGGNVEITGVKDKSVTEIKLPDGVTSVGANAFSGCLNLKKLIISDGVASIGLGAFDGCVALESVTIPDSVAYVNEFAFMGCDNIKIATMPACAIYAIPKTKLQTVVITSGDTIKEKAFYKCSSLKSVTLSNSITVIEYSAFYECSSLSHIKISDNVKVLGDFAFYSTAYCKDEKNWSNGALYIGKHLIEVDNEFSGSFQIKDGTLSIGVNAFFNCESLRSVTIPGSVKKIGRWAFQYCGYLTEINFKGKQSRWNAIEKGEDWDKYTGNYTVRFSN